jgi:hypothetical protein
VATFELAEPDMMDLPVLETLTASTEMSHAGRGPIKVVLRQVNGADATR